MIMLVALLSQDPIVDFKKYKAAYEPYRRCVVSTAKAAYPSGKNFKVIYKAAERRCMDKRVTYSMDALIIELDRPASGKPSENNSIAEHLGTAFDEEVMLELAQDFVPRKR